MEDSTGVGITTGHNIWLPAKGGPAFRALPCIESGTSLAPPPGYR